MNIDNNKPLKQQQADAIFNAAGLVVSSLFEAIKTEIPIEKQETSKPIILNAATILKNFKDFKIKPHKHIAVYLRSGVGSDSLNTKRYRDVVPIMQACGFLVYAAKTAFAFMVHNEKKKIHDISISSIGLVLDDETNTIIPTYVSTNEIEHAKLMRYVNALLTQHKKLEDADKDNWKSNWIITQEKLNVCKQAIEAESAFVSEVNKKLKQYGHLALCIDEASRMSIERKFTIKCSDKEVPFLEADQSKSAQNDTSENSQ